MGKLIRLSGDVPELDLDATLVESLDSCLQPLEEWLVADLGATACLPAILFPLFHPLRDSLDEIL